MAYNFLGLVNDINRRLNEVELPPSNFASAVGQYSLAKDSVNSSIRTINQDKFTWPFNYVEQEDILTAGTMRYPTPHNAKFINYNTFRVKRNSTFGNTTRKLKVMDYENYLENHVDDEYNTDTSIRQVPTHIIRAPGEEYVVYPNPDRNYELVYEYYGLPVDMELYSDIPTIPEAFRHIIVDGAMYYMYKFRGDEASAQQEIQRFSDKLKDMRSIYINRYEYIRDTRV